MAADARPIRRRQAAAGLQGASHLPPLLRRVYAQRGIREARELDTGLGGLHPPGELRNIDAAAARLAQALAERESMLIVGDFDADGATSAALAVAALREFAAERVDYLVPNRFDYGYGLTPELVAVAKRRRPDLIITVDNGISSHAGVAAAREAGIEVLVTDHHLPGDSLPEGALIVNPNQPLCSFPSKHLAGVGVMFYVLLALRALLRERGAFRDRQEPKLANYLDLVALGTVADVVPLDHNNRILVQGGLARLRAGRGRPGIAALLEVAGRQAARLSSTDLAFALGPRLNAAGRLDDMSLGIECLLAESLPHARALAARLDAMNRERQQIERGMERDALATLDRLEGMASEPPAALTLYDPGWHQGVVGILAARVRERLHRPVIAFADAGDGMLKGSGRCIPGLHLRDLLALVDARHPGLIERFGGHAMAAGLSLRETQVERFSAAFASAAAQQSAGQTLEAVCESDGDLDSDEFSLENAELLRLAGPWGQHFPEPLFDGEFALHSQRIVGERHLKMRLAPLGGGAPLDAIAFRVDTQRWPDEAVSRVRVAYRLDVNEWRGERRLQLLVEQLEALV